MFLKHDSEIFSHYVFQLYFEGEKAEHKILVKHISEIPHGSIALRYLTFFKHFSFLFLFV